MHCDAIIDKMTDYLLAQLSGKSTATPDDDLVRHCASCQDCKKKMDIILRIATGADFHLSRPLKCEEVLERMAEMVECEEEELPAAYPAEWLHLQACSDCRKIFALTLSCMTDEYENAFERMREQILHTPAQPGAAWERIGPRSRKLAGRIQVLLGRGKEALAQVPDWLAASLFIPAPAMVHRGPAATGNSYELSVPCPEKNRKVVIRIVEEDEQGVRLRVQLLDAAANLAIGGAVIALLDDQGRFLMQLVAPEGAPDHAWVDFQGIGAGSYILKIDIEGESWEVPLRLA